MPFRPCPSGCGRFLSADDGHDRCLQCLGRRHAEAAFVDDSCVCCGRMSMISLRSRLSFMKGLAPSAATRADLSGSSRGSPADALGDLRVTVRASPPGTPPRTSYSSRSEHPVRFPGDFAGLSHGAPSISFGAPSVDRMSIAASGDGFTSSEDEGAVGLPPSGVVATAAPDPELTAMLARAAVSIGLEVNRPPSPEPSRLNDWFLGAGRGSQPRPAPVPFFPEVHEELTSSWMAPFTARSRSSASSVLTTLDGGVARGYTGIPQVERAVAVHLCPRNAATWRNRPRLPSKACKLTAALAAKAYSAAGQAASALHAMAILQVHQAKALKQVHEGSTDPGLMQELRTATDLALRATKVTARSLGKAMSTMVVQERHLWLNLAEMKDVDKARFLDAPISQGGLFGDTVEGFAQQFSAVQQQTEAIQHILPRREAPSTAAPGARPQSARRRGRPPASSRAAPPQAESRILNYLDDWLILAQSREQLGDHRDLVLRHLSQLGLRVNWEKSKLSPVQRISFLGVELDSVSMTARLTEERAQAVLNCLSSFRGRNVVPLKQFQRLLGHMASAAAVTPLGLLHMRPLQHWLHSRVPRWAWRRGTLRVGISQQCRRSLSPWTDLAFLRAGVPLEQVSRHTVVTTDASSTGWGATCNGQAASGLWTGPRLLWHINCLELWAVHLALRQFRPLLLGKHVLVRTDNTAAVSYINRLGGIRSHRMSQLARHLLLWSHTQFKSLRAVHIPGQLNRAADALSRQLTFPGEWRLHPETIRLIWSRFGEAQVDLFASPESSHCQLYFSLTEGPLGTDALAHSWPRALRKYAFPPVSLLAQTLCKLREDEEQVLLVAPHWPTRTWFPELISLATAPPWRIPLRKDLLSQGLGTIWHPRPDLWNLHVWLLDGTRQT